MLMQTNRSWPPAEPQQHGASEPPAFTMATLVGIARRYKALIGMTTFIVVAFAAVFCFTTKPMYSASADVIIDARNARVIEPTNVSVTSTQLGLDAAAIDSQVQILKSEELALKVIKAWKLDERPEFTQPRSLIVAWLGAGAQQLKSLLAFGGESVDVRTDGVPRDVVDEFAKRLTVKRADETYVINIRFDAETRSLAADIANAVANAYLDEQLDARFDSIKRASSWLEARKAELKDLASAADDAVQRYKNEHGIQLTGPGVAGLGLGDSQSQLLSDQRLAKADQDLAEARKDTEAKQARYDQIMQAINSRDPNFNVPEALTNELINNAKKRRTDNAVKIADLSRRYGIRHEVVQRLIMENQQLAEAVAHELERISESYHNELETAKTRQVAAQATLDKLNSASTEINLAQVKLRDLDRDAQTYKNLYQSFNDRYTQAIQQQTFPITEARILTKASEPRDKSSPKTGLILVLAGLGGVMLGFGFAVLMDMTDSAFRIPADVEGRLQHPCLGVLPMLRDGKAQAVHPVASAQPGQLPEDLGILSYVKTAPLSRFAETLRAVKVAADLAALDGKMKVIGVASSIPNEGKSTVSMNIAQLIAMSGRSVLLIDGDLRNPSLSNTVAPRRKSGLLEYLTGSAPVGESMLTDKVHRLAFLPANGGTRLPQTAELVGAEAMERLLEVVSRNYDYVVIDLPPLAPVVDVRAIARMVDGFVYVIEWGKTSTSTVQQAMQTVPALGDKMLGVVLNKTNMQALRLYSKNEAGNEYYDYHRFSAYTEGH
jgi:succinoglycan biosynthesis transport protein ExoP